MTQKSSKEVETKAKPKVYAVKEEKLNLVLASLQTMKLTAQEHQFIIKNVQSLIKKE